jgi:hypothetical protein
MTRHALRQHPAVISSWRLSSTRTPTCLQATFDRICIGWCIEFTDSGSQRCTILTNRIASDIDLGPRQTHRGRPGRSGEFRGFVLRRLSYAKRRPKLFTIADWRLSFWWTEKRTHIPKPHFPLFLQPCEWRSNHRPVSNLSRSISDIGQQSDASSICSHPARPSTCSPQEATI